MAVDGKGKVIVTGFSVILVIGVIIGLIAAVNSNGNEDSAEQVSASMKAVSQFCSATDYKDACIKSLSSANTNDPKELVKSVVTAPGNSLVSLKETTDKLIEEANKTNDNNSKLALEECKELIDFALDSLHTTFSAVNSSDLNSLNNRVDELSVWVSAVISYQSTCMDGFRETNGTFQVKFRENMENSRQLVSNALAVFSELSNILKSMGIQVTAQAPSNSQRRLLQTDGDGFPTWFSGSDRRMLKGKLTPNAVVAKDGSGKYKTIQDALDDYPKNDLQGGRYVIYVKQGVYDEYITVTKEKVNILMYGDGNARTIVTGKKSYTSGFNTWKTASFCKFYFSIISGQINNYYMYTL